MKFLLSSLLIFCFLSSLNSNVIDTRKLELNIKTVFNDPTNLIEKLSARINQTSRHHINSKKSDNLFDNVACQLQLATLVTGINSTELWAIEFLDSWGKIPSGILYGDKWDLGNFDQCLEYEQTFSSLIGTINGQYCLGRFTLDFGTVGGIDLQTISFILGLCVPKSCDPVFVIEIIQSFMEEYGVTMDTSNQPIYCTTADDQTVKYDVKNILFTILLSSILIVMVGSTIYEIMSVRYGIVPTQILLAFSIISNSKKLFSTHQPNPPDNIQCLHGIRVLTIAWIVYCQGVLNLANGVISNLKNIEGWATNVFSMLSIYSTVAVDTSLLLSGFLVTWAVLLELEKRNKLNIFKMYLHRYIRITPAYIAIMLFVMSYLRYFGSGPYYKANIIKNFADNCENYWWAGMIYLQNYINVNELCITVSCYLSVDMQLFILSPILLYPLWRWGKLVLIPIIGLIIGSNAWAMVIFYTNEISLNMMNLNLNGQKNKILTKEIYYTTHTRMGAWLCGLIIGYIMFQTKSKVIKLSNIFVAGLWIISLGTMLAIIFGPYQIQLPDYNETLIESTIYLGLARVAWCIALSTLIFLCSKGYGGLINQFLSLKFWMPLSRLTYSIFLFHLIIINYRLSTLRSQKYFNDFNTIHSFWGDFGLTATISIFWVLAFESPILVIEKFIFDGRKKQKVVTYTNGTKVSVLKLNGVEMPNSTVSPSNV